MINIFLRYNDKKYETLEYESCFLKTRYKLVIIPNKKEY